MPMAARVADPVTHPTPPVLTGGPGSPNVRIGGRPAWRAVPAELGAAIKAAADAVKAINGLTVLTPIEATALLADVSSKLAQAAAQSIAAGNRAAVGANAGAMVTLNAANVALKATWDTASVAPGGQPAANEAYATGLQTAVTAASSAVFAAIGAMFDMHSCACVFPPHGPGLVTVGSATVRVNGLPLARQSDAVIEAAGGSNPISAGCATVNAG